jgi:hypothetical protein
VLALEQIQAPAKELAIDLLSRASLPLVELYFGHPLVDQVPDCAYLWHSSPELLRDQAHCLLEQLLVKHR